MQFYMYLEFYLSGKGNYLETWFQIFPTKQKYNSGNVFATFTIIDKCSVFANASTSSCLKITRFYGQTTYMYFTNFYFKFSLFILLAVFIRKDMMGKAQLVLLDHGLYDKLTPDDRQSLCNLYKSIVLNKEDKMKEFSKALGVDGILIRDKQALNNYLFISAFSVSLSYLYYVCKS